MPEHKSIISPTTGFLFLFSILLILADITGYLQFYKNFRSILLYPITNGTAIIRIGTRNLFSSLFHTASLKNDNLELRQRIIELEDTIALYKDTRDLTPELQKTLDAIRGTSYKKVEHAQILSTRHNNIPGTLLLSKGASSGVKEGSPVVFGSKYIGYVSEAYTTQSVCTTIQVPGQEFVGYVPRKRVTGILRTHINKLELSDLLSTDPVSLQDTISISFEEYPYFFTVGAISEIPQKEGSAEKTAIIGSTVSVHDITFVTIVLE